jgi:hypothetical protein
MGPLGGKHKWCAYVKGSKQIARLKALIPKDAGATAQWGFARLFGSQCCFTFCLTQMHVAHFLLRHVEILQIQFLHTLLDLTALHECARFRAKHAGQFYFCLRNSSDGALALNFVPKERQQGSLDQNWILDAKQIPCNNAAHSH